MKTKCLSCETDLIIAETTLLGEIVGCSDCGTNFEVIKKDPPQIGAMPEIEEDWGE